MCSCKGEYRTPSTLPHFYVNLRSENWMLSTGTFIFLLSLCIFFKIQCRKWSRVVTVALKKNNKYVFTAKILYMFSLLLSSSGRKKKLLTMRNNVAVIFQLFISFLCACVHIAFWQNCRFAKEGNCRCRRMTCIEKRRYLLTHSLH